MNSNHIKAVMYKQICDTIKNKLILLLIFMYPILAFVFYYLLKDVPKASNMVIPIFITMHIIMAPIVCMSSIISEEKEKNTLKELFFAGVRSFEYLIGIAVVLFVVIIVSLIPYLFILKLNLEKMILYFIFSALGSIASLLLGSVIGILSKNQMSVGTISSPLSMVIGLLPMASMFNETIDRFAKVLYSKRVYDVVYLLMGDESIKLNNEISVCILNIILFIIIFSIAYKKNNKLAK